MIWRELRAAVIELALWSSCSAEVGSEWTESGFASVWFSSTRDAAVYCGIIMPEFNPGQHADKDPGGEPIFLKSIEKIKYNRDPAEGDKKPGRQSKIEKVV